MDKERIEWLDWLRALAAVLVIFGHSDPILAPGGALGVSVFFVLSGFLITSILLRDGMMNAENVGKFIVRRIARIYPMYVVQIVCILALLYALDPNSLSKILPTLTGVLTFTGDVGAWYGFGFAVQWTLAVEFWFYVTFPALIYCAGRHALAAIIVGILLSLASTLIGMRNSVFNFYDHFLIGSIAALAIKNKWPVPILEKRSAFLLAITTILLISRLPFPGDRNLLWHSESLAIAVATTVAIIAGRSVDSFSIPALAYIGRVSYSSYLLHAVILDAFGFAKFFSLPLFLFAVLILSSITYFWIERPIERIVHKYVRYRARPELKLECAAGKV